MPLTIPLKDDEDGGRVGKATGDKVAGSGALAYLGAIGADKFEFEVTTEAACTGAFGAATAGAIGCFCADGITRGGAESANKAAAAARFSCQKYIAAPSKQIPTAINTNCHAKDKRPFSNSSIGTLEIT